MSIIVLKTDSIRVKGLMNLTSDDVVTSNFHAYKESELTIISLEPKKSIAYKLSTNDSLKFFIGDPNQVEFIPIPIQSDCIDCYSITYPYLLATYSKFISNTNNIIKFTYADTINVDNYIINIFDGTTCNDTLIYTFNLLNIGDTFIFNLPIGEYLVEVISGEQNQSGELDLRIDIEDTFVIGSTRDLITAPFDIPLEFHNGIEYGYCLSTGDCTSCIIGSTNTPLLLHTGIELEFHNGIIYGNIEYPLDCIFNNINILEIGSTCTPYNYVIKTVPEILNFNLGTNYCTTHTEFSVGSSCKPVEVINPLDVELEFHNGIDYCYCGCGDADCTSCIVGSTCTPLLLQFNTSLEFHNGRDYCLCQCNDICDRCIVGSTCTPLFVNIESILEFHNGTVYN